MQDTLQDLINEAISIWYESGNPETVWNRLNSRYSQFGEPLQVHRQVLDGADKAIKNMMRTRSSD